MKISQVNNNRQSQNFGAFKIKHGEDRGAILDLIEKHVDIFGGGGAPNSAVITVPDYELVHSLKHENQKDFLRKHIEETAPVISIKDLIGKAHEDIVNLVVFSKAKLGEFIEMHNRETQETIAQLQARTQETIAQLQASLIDDATSAAVLGGK